MVDKAGSKPGKPMFKPITIKTGIADGTFTELLDGLNEGDEAVTGITDPNAIAAAPTTQQTGRSPFGGGGFRGR